MEQRQIDHIRENIDKLVAKTSCNTKCITVLIARKVFGDNDAATLNAIPDKMDRAFQFYNLVMTRTDSYKHLITALKKSCQTGAVEILEEILRNRVSEFKEEENSDNSSTEPGNNVFSGLIKVSQPVKENHKFELSPSLLVATMLLSQFAVVLYFDLLNSTAETVKENPNINIKFEVPDPSLHYAEKVEELTELHQKLQASDNKMTVFSQMLAIVGPAGIGKTELARAYIQHHMEEYDNVIWINAETEQTVTESFHRLETDHLKLPALNIDTEELEITSTIDNVYNVLGGRRSLFVFDNAVCKEHILKFLTFRDSVKPKFMITSRDKDWNFGGEMLELHDLEERAAIQYMKSELKIQGDSRNESIIQLVRRLEYFPLAMSLAVSFIKQTNSHKRFSIDDYLMRLDKPSEYQRILVLDTSMLNLYIKATAAAMEVTLTLLFADTLVKYMKRLLIICTYFEADKISTKNFNYPKPCTEELNNQQQQIDDALDILMKYSIISFQKEKHTISIHPLVQEVFRLNFKAINLEEEILREMLNWFSDRIQFENLSHVFSVFKHSSNYDSLVVDFSFVPHKILGAYNGYGVSQDALEIGNELRMILLLHISFDHVDMLELEEAIAHLEFKLGEFERSLKTTEQILPFYLENQIGLFSVTRQMLLQQLYARILEAVGRKPESLKLYLQVYKKFMLEEGEDDFVTIDVLADIVGCLNGMGYFDQFPLLNTEYLQISSDYIRVPDPHEMILLLKDAYINNKKFIRKKFSYAQVFFKVAKCLFNLGDKRTADTIARYSYEVARNSHVSKIRSIAMDFLEMFTSQSYSEVMVPEEQEL